MREDGTGGAAETFSEVDPRLVVFALANGMDLSKKEGYRRLEWFYDRLERGIVIEAVPGGPFSLKVMAWKSGSGEVVAEAPLEGASSTKELVASLEPAIEAANELQ